MTGDVRFDVQNSLVGDAVRRDAVLGVEFFLDPSAAHGFIDCVFKGIGHGVCKKERPPFFVSRGASFSM